MDEICSCARGLATAAETLVFVIAFQALMATATFAAITIIF